jgi:signal transduction histidine kinase/ActR/RegA family two-component response regulator
MAYRCRAESGRPLLEVAGCARELTGHEADTLLARPGLFAALVMPEDRAAVESAVRDALASDGGFDLVYRICTASGGIRTIHDRGEGVFDDEGILREIVGFASDDPDRVTEQELRLAHRAVVSAALDPLQGSGDLHGYARVISRLAAETLRIRQAGVWLLSEDKRTLARLCAYDAESGDYAGEVLLQAQDYPRYFAALMSGRAIDASDARSDPRTSEFRDVYLIPGGVTSMLDAAIRVGGEIVGVVCCEHTVAHRGWRAYELSFAAELADQMAQALLDVERQLALAELQREQESTRAKSDFLATMSHEIRTPMNGVLGITQLLKGTALDRHQREYVQMIEESGQLLLHIVNDILDYSKMEAGKFSLHPRPCLIREWLASLRRQFLPAATAAGLDLVFDLDPSLPEAMRCDPERLQQILGNLLGNALKFTSSGFVRLEARVDREDGGPVVRLRVMDSGEGIDPALRARLFEPFEQGGATAQAARRGTGLGLAIARRLAMLMDGSLECESVVGQGSVFTLTLPLVVAAPEAATAAPLTEAPPAAAHLRVLVAEDNEINRRVILGLLDKDHGIRADWCANGEEALLRVQQRPYDLVLMDCEMPVMDGYEATRRIRALAGSAARTAIAALTAHAVAELRARAFEAGVDFYLSKPVHREDLAAVVRAAAARGGGTPS